MFLRHESAWTPSGRPASPPPGVAAYLPQNVVLLLHIAQQVAFWNKTPRPLCYRVCISHATNGTFKFALFHGHKLLHLLAASAWLSTLARCRPGAITQQVVHIADEKIQHDWKSSFSITGQNKIYVHPILFRHVRECAMASLTNAECSMGHLTSCS
jgi:hypothetical protein